MIPIKLRIIHLKRSIRRWWYKIAYGVNTDEWHGTMLPEFGHGEFVSVLKTGPYWDIIAHNDYPTVPQGMIRLVPYQPNHGIMVEFFSTDGKMLTRRHLDYIQLVEICGQGKENES